MPSTIKAPGSLLSAIPQALLASYADLRNARLEAEKIANVHKTKEDELRKEISAALAAGAQCSKGPCSALLVPRGRFPDWKGAYVEACGDKAAQNVIESTPYRQELIIQDGRVR